MPGWLKAAVVPVVFLGVGAVVGLAVFRHAGTHGPEARLAAAMAGLFAGGAATVIALIAIFMRRT